MFKVWDEKHQRWCYNIYQSNSGKLFKVKNLIGRRKKFIELDLSNYTAYIDIGMYDKDGNLIYEGDILEVTPTSRGVVLFSTERGTFLLLDYANNSYYYLPEKFCAELKVIGHITEDVSNNMQLLNVYGEDEFINPDEDKIFSLVDEENIQVNIK